ncbi:MAG: molybdopterin-dependent oxidoreductase [Gemmataceae bacterium]|nr:molybdopterin-dependent oxidoreductase [Gemmataceae bacterium]
MDPAPKFLTDPEKFRDVSRGSPKPHSLKGDDLVKARLTPETWRLEIVGDESSKLEKPRKLDDNTAIDLPTLKELGKTHGIKFLKAMQCLNLDQPLGQGLWEGVPLREVLRLVGKVDNVRRVYWHGFHNNDAKQLFQSSLGYNQVMETPPWDLPIFVAYLLNGQPLSLLRGGPVRIVVPWAHGFKSVKWLHRITLTNDYKANDTYANNNNDPDSYLKTMARIDDSPETFKSGAAIDLRGVAMVGWSGLKRVEYWLRPDAGTHGKVADDDPAWKTAKWEPCAIEPAPASWGGQLPDGVMPKDVWGFNAEGKPKDWPMRYSIAQWSVTLKDLKAGAYEFRVRTVDLNGFAQPEPRPYLKSGRNGIQTKTFMVMA